METSISSGLVETQASVPGQHRPWRRYLLTGLALLWTLALVGVFLSMDSEISMTLADLRSLSEGHFEAGSPSDVQGFSESGIDAAIYLVAADRVEQGESPYPRAEDTWQLGTYPYDLTFAAAVIPLTKLPLGAAVAVFHLIGLVALLAVVWLSAALIRGEGYSMPWWGWALLLVNTSLIGTLAYGNVDVVIVAVGLGLLLALRRKHWAVAGVLIGVLFATKFFWLALLAYVVARRDWLLLIKSLAAAAVFHVVTNALVILSLGWETGWNLYLQRYAFLSRVSDTRVRPDYWGNNSLQQTFYNLFGDAGKLPAILAAVALVLLFLVVTFRLLTQKSSPGSDSRAMTYALIAWVVSLMLQPRLEYAGLVATIFLYGWSATRSRVVRMWSLGALPYVLAQFPTLVGQFMGFDWLNLAVSPAIILGLLTSLVALLLLLREQGYSSAPS